MISRIATTINRRAFLPWCSQFNFSQFLFTAMLMRYSDDQSALRILLDALINFLIECAQNRNKIASENILLVLITLYRSPKTNDDNKNLALRALKNLVRDGWWATSFFLLLQKSLHNTKLYNTNVSFFRTNSLSPWKFPNKLLQRKPLQLELEPP